MSGHSKWHNIQKTKGAQDAKRAAAFTKIAKELIVAVKEGGGITDPANNSRLATVITKAKAANMPNDNIKRCLEKASGTGGVVVSALEMVQNSLRYSWTRQEVDNRLKQIMSDIYDASAAAAEEYGLGYDLIAGNDIAAFKKISQAMIAQGL